MSGTENSLDLAVLNELKDILEEGLEELLEEYLEDTPRQLSLLRAAVDAGDVSEIGTVAHTLKGSSGNLGISALYLLCAALEQEAKEGAVIDASASLAALEVEFDKVKLALVSFMEG